MKITLRKLLFIVSMVLFASQSFGQKQHKVSETKTETGGTVTQYRKGDFVYEIVDEPAQFPGGIPALKNYLIENLKYPQIAVDKGLQGKCYVQFVVSETGAVEHVKIKKGVRRCKECDLEALRVVKNMPKWEPGKVNEKPVNSTFTLPISFKL